jgi:hypothetical protein
LYFSFFSASFCTISLCGYCHIYQYARFLLFVFNYYICPICCNFSVCVYCFIIIIIIIISLNIYNYKLFECCISGSDFIKNQEVSSIRNYPVLSSCSLHNIFSVH